MKVRWFTIFCCFILVFQIGLLVVSFFLFRGNITTSPNVVFLRVAMLLGSAMMVIMTRYFLRLTHYFNLKGGQKALNFLRILYMMPAILIPAGGFVLSRLTGSYKEYLLFFIIGLYHLARYFNPVKNLGGQEI